jgi:LmbE family N-acetylglucosaminyl deacetylase
MTRSIVAIMAHADDIEFCAGGTLAKFVGRGYRALYGVLSRCNSGWTVTEAKGPHYVSSLDIVPRRRAEAAAAAKVFGAELYQGDLLENCYTRRDGARIVPSFVGATDLAGGRVSRDDDVPAGELLAVAAGAGTSWKDNPTVREVARLLVEWEPELVIGQEISNFNPDHHAAALIVAMAWSVASEQKKIGPYWIPVGHPSADEFRFSPIEPTTFVDVTGHEERCIQAMSCHRSQGGHLEPTHRRLRESWAGWGARCGAASAEAFHETYPGT